MDVYVLWAHGDVNANAVLLVDQMEDAHVGGVHHEYVNVRELILREYVHAHGVLQGESIHQ